MYMKSEWPIMHDVLDALRRVVKGLEMTRRGLGKVR